MKLQKGSIRLIAGSDSLVTTSSIFIDLNILPFKNLYLYNCLCFLRNHPEYIANNFRSSTSSRINNFTALFVFHSSRGQNSFLYRCKSLLNKFDFIERLDKTKLKSLCIKYSGYFPYPPFFSVFYKSVFCDFFVLFIMFS